MPQYHDLIKTALEIFIKYKLESQRSDLWKYACMQALSLSTPDLQQIKQFEIIFKYNGIDPKDFATNLHNVLNKTDHKINSIRLWGAPNSCKSLIGNCIVKPFICCYMNNHGSENEFFLSNMLNKSIVLCEELYITIATAEDFKSVLGGQNIDIAKKFNEKQLLSRTPIIITSNYAKFGRGHLSAVDENALALRCHNYHFTTPIKPTCTLDWMNFYHFVMAYL